MRRRVLPVLAFGLVLGALACSEPTPTRPNEQPLAAVTKGPALEAQINGLINALFAPKDQGDIFKAFARIKNQLASGKTAEAQASVVAFVQLLLTAQQGGVLQDPNGAQPPSIADALRDLVNSVAQLGGLPPPIPPSNPFAGDGAVAVVGSAGGTVVSSSGFGGVGFPPGALPADVIVVVSRLPNPVVEGAGPLPTTLTQYPLFYDFSTVPHVAQFAVPVTVGLCRLEVGDPFGPPTQAIADQLQVAHPDPANPTTIEILPVTTAGFVNCNGVTLASARDESEPRSLAARAWDLLKDGGTQVLGLLRPGVAYAIHGGLGGKTTSFSPFGAVDPGPAVAGGTFIDRDLGVIGTAFVFNPIAFGGTVKMSGPPNWNGGNPLIAGVYQPPGISPNRSIWWEFVTPVSGSYLAQSLLGGANQQAQFSVDATAVINTPRIVLVSLPGAGQVQIDWDSASDNKSCLVRVNEVPWPGFSLAEDVVSCAQESFLFTGLPLVAGNAFQATVFAFSQDVQSAGSMTAVFNIGSDDAFFVAPAFVASASAAALPLGPAVSSGALKVPPSPPLTFPPQ